MYCIIMSPKTKNNELQEVIIKLNTKFNKY